MKLIEFYVLLSNNVFSIYLTISFNFFEENRIHSIIILFICVFVFILYWNVRVSKCGKKSMDCIAGYVIMYIDKSSFSTFSLYTLYLRF